MGIKNQIRDLDEYQETAQTQGQGRNARQAAANATRPNPVEQSLGPVLSWEKTDVEFWMQVAQVVLLYLILRELKRGGRL